jgi:hypothetical protein
MNSIDADALYALLPAFVRLQDQAQGGGVLRALVGVIAQQAQVVDAGLDQLYDDQFIETCAPWVVPYLGDLIGFTPLRPLGPGQPAATRAEVADTIGYRRGKGTLAVLEQLCFDVTGWPGMAVEYFTRLSATQYVRNHLRPGNSIVDVRSPMTAVDVDGAFDLPPRSADVRRIDSGRGRYNVPSIGLFVWRLKPYTDPGAGQTPWHPARAVGANRYTFDPFGGDVPLVNPVVNAPGTAAAGAAVTGGAAPPPVLRGRVDLPFFLQRYPLYAGLPSYAAATPAGVRVNGETIAPAATGWCDLSGWTPPTVTGMDVAIDPVLGRLVFARAPSAADEITVNFTYAFSGDYGGGIYAYPVTADEATTESQLSPGVTQPLADADLAAARHGLVEITDSGILPGDLTLSPDADPLVIRAADMQRPVLAGGLSVTGVAGASVTLRGLGIGGALTISGAGPLTIRLEHCTVRGGIDWSAAAVSGTLTVDHSLCGAVEVNPDVEVNIADSAVDAGSDTAAALSAGAGAAAGSVTIARSTILGSVTVRTIGLLENSIVTGSVVSAQRQNGCLRYSFVPLAQSQTPRRFRCQPDLEIDTEVAAALAANPALSPSQHAAIAAAVQAWLLPAFTSRTPGQPGYLQLAAAAPDQIRLGAQDGDEMGVFYGLFSARRQSNLSYRLAEYLRIGLEAGIIHAT